MNVLGPEAVDPDAAALIGPPHGFVLPFPLR
jgi:hypothetical protein